MAGIVDPSPRSPLGRLLPGPVRGVARNLWGTFRFAPWPVKIMLVLIFVGGPAAVVIRYTVQQVRGARHQRHLAEWKGFEEAVKVGDDDKMRAALDRVLALVPDEPTALGRRQAMDTGEADPADQPMVLLNIRRHLRAGRLADAERESRKRLAAEKNDWLARCVVAAALAQRGDKAGARAELDQLPEPGDSHARLDPGGLLLAVKLFRATDKDPAPLRQFIQGVILPILRSPGSAQLGAGEKSALVECYTEAFDLTADRRQPAALAEAWASAAKLLDAAADEALEGKEAAVLTRVGRLGDPLEAGLAALRRGEQVTEAEHAALLGDLRDRGRRVWEGLLAADPTNPEANRGLAVVLLRNLDAAPLADRPKLYDQARGVLVRGVQARPDDPELAQLFARLLTAEGRPLDATQFLIGLARQHPDKPVWWALAAETAVAAGRRELALDACTQMRANDPDNRWAVRTEARLLVDAGENAKALLTLARLGDDAIAHDPLAAYSYTRALAETLPQSGGAADRLAGFVRLVAGAEQPAVAGAVGRGLADAPGLAPATATAHANTLLERYQNQPELLRAKAFAAYRDAETGTPLWEVGRVAAAARAVELALLKLPDDLELVTQLGWLRLAGEGNAAAAARAVAPLRRAEDRLTPRQAELLGAVALAEKDWPTALRHLQRATRVPDPPAGAFALLARAYHATGQRGPANAALQTARGRPRSPREQAEYLTAARQVAP